MNSSSVLHSYLANRSDLHLLRKLWHVSTGMLIFLVYWLSDLTQYEAFLILGGLFVIFTASECIRLRSERINALAIRIWGPVMRSHEALKFSGTPYYLASCALVVLVFPKTIALLSVLFLAVGDPMASLVGILAKGRGIRFANGKSLAGTLAAVAVCFVISWVFLSYLGVSQHREVYAIVGALAGGLAEHIPFGWDDNLSIPLVSGLALWITSSML